jgi:hypothetical protein
MTNPVRSILVTITLAAAPVALLCPCRTVGVARAQARVTPARMVQVITDMGYRARVQEQG